MKKFTVDETPEGWVAKNVRGKVVCGPYDLEWKAYLYGTHWAYAPTTFKRLGFKKADTGSNYRAWTARPFWGIKATITKHPGTDWHALVEVDDNRADARAETFKTREKAADWVNTFGDEMVMTTNLLNPKAGEFPISRREKGRCTDPGTDLYHRM